MFWRQLGISIFIGAFIGAFLASGLLQAGILNQVSPLSSLDSAEFLPRSLSEDKKAPEKIKTWDQNNKASDQKKDPEKVAETSPEGKILPEQADPEQGIDSVKPVKPAQPIQSKVQAPLVHNNQKLNNFNVLFLGAEDKKLQMLAIYSINKEHNYSSGALFIPTGTLVSGTKDQNMADYFQQQGREKMIQLLEREMEIKIDYYMLMDRQLLFLVEPYLEPIYIDEEKIDITGLFTRQISPADELILTALLKNLTKPKIYFEVLPKLVLSWQEYVKTDFSLSWGNLWQHYQIARHIDTSKVKKKIISGKWVMIKNRKYWLPTREAWWNALWQLTGNN